MAFPTGPRASATPTTSTRTVLRVPRVSRSHSVVGRNSPPSASSTRRRFGTARNNPAPTMAVPGRASRLQPSPPTIGVRAAWTNASSTARTRAGAQRAALPASVWMASTCSGDAAPMAENASGETTPSAARSVRRSRGGWLVVTWMSQPPVTASGSAYAVRVAVSMTADTVKLSTTSANMVRVSPVRKRLAAT